MLNDFKLFLKQKNYSLEYLIEYIENVYGDKNNEIVIYSSHIDGLGNNNSDIDVYVFSYGINDVNYIEIKNDIVSNIQLDVELRSIRSLDKIYNKYKNVLLLPSNIDVFELKLLQRLQRGIELKSNSFNNPNQIMNSINNLNINTISSDYYSFLARSEYDDGIRMYNSVDFISARECLRKACIYQAGSVNAIYNRANLKHKWIIRIFLELDELDNEILHNLFMECIVYENISSNNIQKETEKLINLYQMLVSEVAFAM